MIDNLGEVIDTSRKSLLGMSRRNPNEAHYAIHIDPPSRDGTSAGLVDMVGRLLEEDMNKKCDTDLIYDPVTTNGVNTLVANICPEDGQLRVIFSRES